MVEFSYGSDTLALTPDLKPRKVGGLLGKVRRKASGGVVISVNPQNPPSPDVIAAAAEAAGSAGDVELYLLGYGADLNGLDLAPFHGLQHLNCNLPALTRHNFLSDFPELRTLMLQGSARHIDLSFLQRMPALTRLSLSGPVRGQEHLASSLELTYLACASDGQVFGSLSRHPALTYLNVTFGANRDLTALTEVPLLRGLGLFGVRGLDGDDLAPLGDCAGLTALSLGALRNVTHLRALNGFPSTRLRALLLEQMPNLADLSDIAACEALIHLGLYEARPQDKSLAPLRSLIALTHLVLGDAYPKAEIDGLLSWYQGSIHYRGKVARGEFLPRWRTSIERLASAAAS